MVSKQKFHVLSLNGDVVLFKCRPLTSKGSEILCLKMSFDPDSGVFVNRADRVLSVFKSSSRKVELVQCSTAVDLRSGQRNPCVLLKVCKKASQGVRYMLFSITSSSARLQVDISLPYEMGEHVFILNGPMLVWTHRDSVVYASSETLGVKQGPAGLKVTFVGELPFCQKHVVILGSQMPSAEEASEADGPAPTLLYVLEDERTFDGRYLIPASYCSVIRCMVVLSAKDIGGTLRSSVVVATSKKQLVSFKNGLPEDVCVLPYEEPQSIQMVHTGTGCLIVVLFQNGNVCAVWKDTFKVAMCWTSIQHVVVGDFLGRGFDQMLLLCEGDGSSEEEEEPPGKFLLTDLCGLHLTNQGAEALPQCEPAEENLVLTVHALNSRLQSGRDLLQDLQRDLYLKDHMISQCISALHHLLSDRNFSLPPAEQEGLVTLLDEQREEEEKEKCFHKNRTQESESPFKLETVWYRILKNQLVIGTLLTPTNHTPEWENMLSAVLAASPVVQTWTKLLHYPEALCSVTFAPRGGKRSRVAGGPAVMLVTDLISMWNPDQRCSALLRVPPTAPAQGDLLTLDLRGAPQGRLQPHLLRDCGEDSRGAWEDLLSVMAAFRCWSFEIRSRDRTVVDIAAFLQREHAAEPVTAQPEYLVSRAAGSGDVLLYHWRTCSLFQGRLEVYCGDALCLIHLLESLCDFLPTCHHIQLLKSGRSIDPNLTLFMESEILMLKEGVARLMCSKSGDAKLAGDFRLNPEQWNRDRNESRLRPQVEPGLFRQMLRGVIKLQLDCDVAAMLRAELL